MSARPGRGQYIGVGRGWGEASGAGGWERQMVSHLQSSQAIRDLKSV